MPIFFSKTMGFRFQVSTPSATSKMVFDWGDLMMRFQSILRYQIVSEEEEEEGSQPTIRLSGAPSTCISTSLHATSLLKLAAS